MKADADRVGCYLIVWGTWLVFPDTSALCDEDKLLWSNAPDPSCRRAAPVQEVGRVEVFVSCKLDGKQS